MSLWNDPSLLIPKPRNTRPPTPVVILPAVPAQKLTRKKLQLIAANRRKHVVKAIKAFTPPSKKSTREILDEVCYGAAVSMDEIRSDSKAFAVTSARQWLMYRLRDERGLDYKLIATMLNKSYTAAHKGILEHAKRYCLPVPGEPE